MTDQAGSVRRGILAQDVLIQSVGFRRRRGKAVAASELPPGVWESWVDEGIVKPYPDPDLKRTAQAKTIARKKRAEKKVL